MLRWTKLQIKIASLLNQGKPQHKVAKSLGVAKSVVSKVKSALKSGDEPPAKQVYLKGSPHSAHKNVNQPPPGAAVNSNPNASAAAVEKSQGEVGDEQISQAQEQAAVTQYGNDPLYHLATVIKLVPHTIVVPMTPIMLAARDYCTTKLGWRADMPWENFIDTILYLLFKHLDPPVILQSWYEDDSKSKEKVDSLNPAWGSSQEHNTDESAGKNIVIIDEKTKQLARSIGQQIWQEIKQQE